jgi:hypothetical protein
MSDISKISLNSTEYNIKDANAQPRTLATPITVEDSQYTTVEGALGAINNKPSGGGSIGMDTVDTEDVMLVTSNEM